MNQEIAGSDEIEMEVELASPWARIGAALLNLILIFAVNFIPLIFYPYILDSKATKGSYSTTPGVWLSLVLILVLILAFSVWQIVSMSKRGQSLGKRILGIKVIKLDGENPGFYGTVFVRECVYGFLLLLFSLVFGVFISGTGLSEDSPAFEIIAYLPTLACLVMLFIPGHLRRTLQDYLAKTIVVKA